MGIPAHGGITLSEPISSGENLLEWIRRSPSVHYCDEMKKVIEDKGFDFFTNYWVMGFDTGHYGDGDHCDQDYVWQETISLYEKCRAMSRYEKLKKINDKIKTGRQSRL